MTRDFRPLNMASYLRNNRQSWLHSGVIDTLWHAQRSNWHRCDMYSGVIDIAVICAAMSLTLLCKKLCRKFSRMILNTAQWSNWLCCDMHSSVSDTAVTCTAESLTQLCKYDTTVTLDLIYEGLWLPLKGISIEKTYIGKFTCTISLTSNKKYRG
jgi:hypothetical protein